VKRLALALAAVAVVAIALLAWAPAALVLPKLLPESLELGDVRGTLWHGQAGQLHWQGQPLGSLAWEASPAALLRGEFEVRLHLAGPLRASGRLRQGITGSVFEQVLLELPATWLDGVLATPVLQPRGRIEVALATASFAQGQWQALDGQAHWRDAALTGVAAAPLGELRADFALVAPGRVEGELHDLGGPLDLSGKFHVASAGYRVEARLLARDPALAPALAWLGQPSGAGRQLELQGHLFVPAGELAPY
jgi:general secretion pathway protein N